LQLPLPSFALFLTECRSTLHLDAGVSCTVTYPRDGRTDEISSDSELKQFARFALLAATTPPNALVSLTVKPQRSAALPVTQGPELVQFNFIEIVRASRFASLPECFCARS